MHELYRHAGKLCMHSLPASCTHVLLRARSAPAQAQSARLAAAWLWETATWAPTCICHHLTLKPGTCVECAICSCAERSQRGALLLLCGGVAVGHGQVGANMQTSPL